MNNPSVHFRLVKVKSFKPVLVQGNSSNSLCHFLVLVLRLFSKVKRIMDYSSIKMEHDKVLLVRNPWLTNKDKHFIRGLVVGSVLVVTTWWVFTGVFLNKYPIPCEYGQGIYSCRFPFWPWPKITISEMDVKGPSSKPGENPRNRQIRVLVTNAKADDITNIKADEIINGYRELKKELSHVRHLM